MIRHSAKLTALAAVALLGGAVVTSCSKTTNPPDIGTAKLALLIDGATVSSVAYTVLSSTNATLASGTINVSDPNATISIDLSLPAGTGDVVKLTATTSTGLPCSGTSTPFNIVSGQSTTVNLTLTCGGGITPTSPGTATITATVVQGDNCPSIVASSASPAQTSVGGSISVSALATDPDTTLTPPDVLTYAWSPAANFLAPTSASTTYNCTAAGTQTLTLTVNDNHVPTSCPAVITMTVNCVNVAVCGNGVIEPGETCDPPNGTTCSALCQTQTPPPVCGNGIIETGETCEPPNTATCDASCHTIVVAPVCGNGKIETGETCDPPNGTTCDANCQTIVQDNCSICELAGTNAGVCFNTEATTPPTNGTLAQFGCSGFPGADNTECIALVACLRGSACQAAIHAATADYGEAGVGFDDTTPCLCGGIAKATCLAASSWTGVCAPQYVAASDGGNVLSLFFSTDSPIGVANNLMTCDIDDSCQTQCKIGQ